MDVYELENPVGVILAMGGQIPNNMVCRILDFADVTIVNQSCATGNGSVPATSSNLGHLTRND